MGTAWKHWLFQSHRPPEISYFPVSDHLRTHQDQSPQSLGTPRTAGRCNRAGGGLPTAVLYPRTKIERPQRGPNRRYNPRQFRLPSLIPTQGTQRLTGGYMAETNCRPRSSPYSLFSVLIFTMPFPDYLAAGRNQSGCGLLPAKKRLAAAYGKPNALLALPKGS